MSAKTFILLVFLSVLTIAVLLWAGLPPGHSAAFNYPWAFQYAEAMTWQDPFPRQLPGLWAGMGGQDFFFYAPLPFWTTAALVGPLCGTCSAEVEYVIGSALILVASGISMFALLRCLFGSVPPAIIGAVVYMLLPYHLLLDWFERQAVGEFTTYAFLPLVALGVERLRRGEGGGYLLALSVAGTALSHLPTLLLAAHVFAPLCLIFAAIAPGGRIAKLLLLGRFLGFGLLGLGVAAFYWLPAVSLIGTVSSEILYGPYFEAWRWLYGPGQAHPSPDFAQTVAFTFLTCAPILVVSFLCARGALLLWIVIPAGVAIALNLTLTAAIWQSWIIFMVQFPWRLMSLVDLATAIAAAALVARLDRQWVQRVGAIALMLAMVPYALVMSDVTYRSGLPAADRYVNWAGAQEYLSPEMTNAVRSRMPTASFTHFSHANVVATVTEMARDIEASPAFSQMQQRRNRAFIVEAQPDMVQISVPVQYWSLWRAEDAAGTPLRLRAHPEFGTIDILAPEAGFAAGSVRAQLSRHSSETWGAVISLLALVLMLGLRLAASRRSDFSDHAA